MIYAPIIIPTLNRIEHLKRCIRSLQDNAWAEYTPLIISVDYPPEDKYRDGYQKICAYLRDGVAGFLNLKFFFQKKNLGVYGNIQFLRSYVAERYDRYIYIEDDNELSPNFIEYIDKGLELFENDDRVVAVCASGAAEEKDEDDSNVVLSHNFSAWGYGTWVRKMKTYEKEITRESFLNIASSWRMLLKIYQYDYELVYALQNVILRRTGMYRLPDGQIPVIDMTLKIYMVLNDKYAVCPKLQKVRNWGYDGSGVNCLLNDLYDPMDIRIDRNRNFSYCYMEPMEVNRIFRKNSLATFCRATAAYIEMLLWKICRERHLQSGKEGSYDRKV